MGGEETGVTESTRMSCSRAPIFCRPAFAAPRGRLNLPSDASYRFERGVDPGMILRGFAARRRIDARNRRRKARRGNRDSRRTSRAAAGCFACATSTAIELIGVTVPPERVDRNSATVRFGKAEARRRTTSELENSELSADLQRDVDLIEEVVRAFGIDRIAGTRSQPFHAASRSGSRYDFEIGDCGNALVGAGLSEARTSTLIPRDVGRASRGARSSCAIR